MAERREDVVVRLDAVAGGRVEKVIALGPLGLREEMEPEVLGEGIRG